eukprot:jgi/Mesvir1/15355/Mv06558-RA.1
MALPVRVINPNGSKRVVSTKDMPGRKWVEVLTNADCRLEICTSDKVILSQDDIIQLIGKRCDGVICQLTEDWSGRVFSALKAAGGVVISNMAVGYNNINVEQASAAGIAVGNTPGVLTETTAELAVALTMAAARRVVEADKFMRAGLYKGWLPTMFVGAMLFGKTVGIIGAGRIGAAYARMMVEGFKMNLVYYDLYQNKGLESYLDSYAKHLAAVGEKPITWKRVQTMEEVLQQADVVSLHPVLDKSTYHLINKQRLATMKKNCVLVNASRGPVVDEVALVEHLRANPEFRVGLDVFEDEPLMKPGLAECPNAVVVPHIASASEWTRSGMAALAACNVAMRIRGAPLWDNPNNVIPFVTEGTQPPFACPSIVNGKELGLPIMPKGLPARM